MSAQTGSQHSYDYIVIGGGSSGCVIASRLVAAGKSVLLLEAGPPDRDFFIRIPGGIQKINKALTWNFWTQPEAAVDNRRIFMKQGRLLGGGSSVNGMVYRAPVSLFGHDRGLKALRHGLQWMLFRSGLLTSNVVESGGFLDTGDERTSTVRWHQTLRLRAGVRR